MKKKFYKDKNILIAGGTGLVGQQLVNKLVILGANVSVASKDNKNLDNKNVKKFYNLDLSNIKN